ncbi:oligopeptide ABC transporter substrate-binding protein [Williamsoniiplasma somnilux]|uniref:Oligopeptide ABC transporter substrate-binding protein n=1 Tax=Williamsoniiplasma somnilux TaxID=215578 RepID=A0A2K8NYL0_9MOLU|nr:oligopeptide ABC transporter substrate-binding protein OppA [Williamsoniiplasma somnilux]ATZ18887.1 oligopeptide ABC transporter substrate-binding protein [Williamsoniiplasma somnilux]
MKKILLSLAAFAIVGSSAVSVVACGPVNFNSLLTRRESDNIFKGTFKAPMTYYSSATTMQSEDSAIISNLVDTLLAGDEHNNYQGDLADRWASNADSTKFYFHVRDEISDPGNVPTWVDINQNVIDKVDANDMLNTMRYIFNPNNMSQTTFAWSTIIKNGEKLSTAIDQLRTKDSGKYNAKFDQNAGTGDETQKTNANRNIDRFILAFNVTEELDAAREKALSSITDEELLVESQAEGKMMQIANKPNEFANNDMVVTEGQEKFDPNLVVHLQKPTPYFEGLAAFLAWAPIPDRAVQYYQDWSSAGYNYASKGFENILYSSAYVIENYEPTQTIRLTKNNNYFNKDNVFIDKAIYSYTGGTDVSKARMLFEAGDISEVTFSPSDAAGWSKYVGENTENPKFEGSHSVTKLNGTTFELLYNFNNTDEKYADANKALALNSVRQFLAYRMNRSYIAKYYSEAMDGGNKTSKLVRNIFTSKNTTTVDKQTNTDIDKTDKERASIKYDYVDYYNDIYSSQYNNIPSPEVHPSDDKGQYLTNLWSSLGDIKPTDEQINNWKAKFANLSDGIDAYLDNDLIGVQAFLIMDDQGNETVAEADKADLTNFIKHFGKYEYEDLKAKTELIISKIKRDLKAVLGKESVTIQWMTSGATATTVNLRVNDIIGAFVDTQKDFGIANPLNIVQTPTTDNSEFSKKQNEGAFSIMISGWSPDFADPANFLNTVTLGGSFDAFFGWSKLFKKGEGGKIDFISTDVNEQKAFMDLKNRFQQFSKLMVDGDNEGVLDTRANKLALAELSGVMRSQFLLPIYAPVADKTPSMTYVDVFTRSTQPSGQAVYRLIGVKMLSKLWNREEYNKAKTKFENEEFSYPASYPRGHNGKDKLGD